MKRAEAIIDQLEELFPNAQCELTHQNIYQLAVAVSLSAQTTDASVNRVTPALFEKYPDLQSLSEASISDVEECIHSLGLYRNKAKNIVKMAQIAVQDYQGTIPDNHYDLERLPGIGRKCANVILSVGYNRPAIAVDTHVHRVARRLKIAPVEATVKETEEQLMRQLPQSKWSRAHHLLIFMGRYLCSAQHPQCYRCPFVKQCCYHPKNLKQ